MTHLRFVEKLDRDANGGSHGCDERVDRAEGSWAWVAPALFWSELVAKIDWLVAVPEASHTSTSPPKRAVGVGGNVLPAAPPKRWYMDKVPAKAAWGSHSRRLQIIILGMEIAFTPTDLARHQPTLR